MFLRRTRRLVVGLSEGLIDLERSQQAVEGELSG